MWSLNKNRNRQSEGKRLVSDRYLSITKALNQAVEIFISHSEDTFDDMMSNALLPIASAAELQRITIFWLLDGNERLGQRYVWAYGGTSALDNELIELPNNPSIARWLKVLARDECINIRLDKASKDEVDFLSPFKIKSAFFVPVFTHNTFVGIVAMEDHVTYRYFDEDCLELLSSAAHLCANAFIRKEGASNADTAYKALEHRGRLINALNRTATILLSQSDTTFGETMTAGMKYIADIIDLDRISVWRNVTTSDGLHVSQIYRWDRNSGGTTGPTAGLVNASYANLAPRWETFLAEGNIINSPARLLPEAVMLQSFGVVSAFIAPVFSNNVFWGFMLFEDRHNERYFDDEVTETMLSAVYLCTNAIVRAEMEHEIASSYEFNKALIESAPIGFTMIDENLNVVECNEAILERLSTTREYYKNHFFEFSPEYQDDGQRSDDKASMIIKKVLNGERVVCEWMYYSKTGEPIPAELTVVRTKYGDKYVALGYQYDLRNTKKLTAALKEQSEQLKIRLEQQELISDISRGFISSGDSETYVKAAIAKLGHYHNVSQVLIFRIDYQHNSVYPAYHWSADGTPLHRVKFDMFNFVKVGFPESLPESASVPVISCPDIAASMIESFYPLLAADVNAFICAPLYAEGRLWGVMSVEQCSRPREWTENEKGFVAMTASTIAGVIMRDIYNTMLKDTLHKATAASRAKSEFLSNMSHEMRTPLNAIIGMTTIAKSANNIERKDYALDKIDVASTHLLGVINDVLDMSKIEANMLELSLAEFNFERMIQQVVNVVNFRVEEKKQELTIHIDPAIPKTLIGDEQRLAQVITNLLGNAVKFTPEKGSISLKARFAKEESDGVCTLEIAVSDTGIGISAEQQKKLFRSFQQAESSTTRKFGGTGLGLAISKKIVELMNGTIWIKSESQEGSTFTFTVQMKHGIRQEQELLTDIEQKEKIRPDLTGLFAGRCILLVEDVEINREIVQALRETTQLQIDCAENGLQAVRMFSQNPQKYGIIFMDVQMPEMDGYEATRQIRAMAIPEAKSVKIIAMTANVFREDVEKCLRAGMDNHVGKPLNIDEVVDKMLVYLR
jgi:signal transduction histidine kinase/CheY-like chemotaxis protein/PAS domain-containing protein